MQAGCARVNRNRRTVRDERSGELSFECFYFPALRDHATSQNGVYGGTFFFPDNRLCRRNKIAQTISFCRTPSSSTYLASVTGQTLWFVCASLVTGTPASPAQPT